MVGREGKRRREEKGEGGKKEKFSRVRGKGPTRTGSEKEGIFSSFLVSVIMNAF